MAKIFLDTNFFIDLVEMRKEIDPEVFKDHHLFISVLSVHILCYIFKKNIPAKKLGALLEYFNMIASDASLVQKSLIGPTKDFEDNLQLHSAAKEDCEFFLTNDKQILKLEFFGKVRIVSKMEQ